MASITTKLALYDLEGRDGRRLSPFCWRTKYALAHKGLKWEDRPVGFGEIQSIGDGSHRTVPVLDHDGKLIGDSWKIAVYLDQTFQDAPPIFPSLDALHYAQFVERWLFTQVFTAMFPALVRQIHEHARPEDQDYVRRSRELQLGGMSLEDAEKRGAEGLGAMAVALAPLRAKLADMPYLNGNEPGYADIVAASTFMWARAVYPKKLFPPNDTVIPWFKSILEMHGALGRSAPGYDITGA